MLIWLIQINGKSTKTEVFANQKQFAKLQMKGKEYLLAWKPKLGFPQSEYEIRSI